MFFGVFLGLGCGRVVRVVVCGRGRFGLSLRVFGFIKAILLLEISHFLFKGLCQLFPFFSDFLCRIMFGFGVFWGFGVW